MINLEEYRIRATRLLKDLRAADRNRAAAAAERLRVLPSWADCTAEEIVAHRGEIRRKHVLTVIAREAGQPDWPSLKASLAAEPPRGFDTTRLFDRRTGGFLNLWYSRYDQAREGLAAVAPGSVLFPYRTQYVVCGPAFLEELGMDVLDQDWERIGYDWAKPRDAKAAARLAARLRKASST